MSAGSPPGLVSRLGLADATATALVAAAANAADEIERPMSIAVVDQAGALMAFLRMDGAYLASAQIAQDKAYSAIAFTRPTAAWADILASDPVLATGLPAAADRLVTLGGGVPITVDGQVVGAIGVSGGHYTQDVQVAERAIAAALTPAPV